MQNRVAEFAALRTAVDDAAERVKQLHTAIVEAEAEAAAHSLKIDSGKVVVAPPFDEFPETGSERWHAMTKAILAVQDQIEQIMRTALDIDADLSTVMLSIAEGNIDDDGATTLAAAAAAGAEAGRSTVTEPPKNGTPAENKAWWDTLSPAERAELIKNRPELVGNRDGIPVTDRHKANKILLEDQKQDLLGRREEVEEGLARAKHLGDRPTETSLQDELEAINGKLNGIETINQKLDATKDAKPDDKYYLLRIDSAGDGQAILAKGNPDTADNVATYIPGTGQELSNIGSNIDRSDRMQEAAEKSDPSKSTSVITYMGYDAPDHLGAATEQSYAHDAKGLDSFQDGLRATHEGPASNNSVLGHSYGFVTAAIGAHDEGLAVDNLIAVGAPGGVYDHARDLGVDNVYSTVNDQDPVQDGIQIFHGPEADKDWGATEFEASPAKNQDSWPASIEAHSEYWDYQNKALRNMGHIIAGNPDKATPP